MAPTKYTVCLIGPVGSGKTSLLQTFVDSVELATHGYGLGRRIKVQDIEASEFEKGGQPAPTILGNKNGDYQKLKTQFPRQTYATEETVDYYFRLDSFAPNTKESAPILLRVVDSAGEFAIPEGEARIEKKEDQIQKLREALQQADAVVFAIPLTRMDSVGWEGSLRRIIGELAHPDLTNPSRVVVAFTHYERLFANLGQEAFAFACVPQVARGVISRALEQSSWGEDLRQLRQRNVSVYFTVTSAYGFVKGYGNPNIDPHQNDEGPFGRNGTTAAMPMWRPFLTAEPFICAALDEPSEFTIPFEKIYGRAPTPPLPPPLPPPPPPPPGLFKSVFNWLNRNSG